MECSSKVTGVELETAEPLLGYALLHLISSPIPDKTLSQVAAYLLAPCANGRALFRFLQNYARAHIASHFQNGQYQHYRQISALYILS
jgi:hypothetical protein